MKALQSEPVAVVNDRVSEVKRRLAAAEAMQDVLLNFGDRGRAVANQLPDKAYAGVLESVRRRFEEAESLQKSLRHALSDELVRTRQLQAQLKERPAALSPCARELESLKQETAELRSERDAACAQCRLQTQELHTLRQQLQVREDERRELVNRLSSCLGSYLIDCDLGSEELQRGLEAITATRDAALQSARQERDSLQILKQQLASMRAERDEAQARLKAEEQQWSSRMGELASAESRIEEASEQALARRRTEEETWHQTATRCAEAEAAKKKLQEQLAEERTSSMELRLEVQSLSRGKKELQMELERSQASKAEELDLDGQPDLERLQRQLFRAKQEIDSLRVRTQVKESLLEQTEGELQKNVRRLGELSAEKAQLQWEAAEQGKSELQLRQRLQTAEAKLLEAVRENRAEGEASFLLAESKKQLATLEDSNRSLIEGLEWEKAEVQRLKSEVQRVSQERDLCRAREVELVEAESKSQGTLRRLQRESSDLKACLEDERAARHHLETVAATERARLEEELARERHCLMLLQEEIQVEQRLRHEAEDALAEVERRLGSVEVEQQKICLVENDRAKSRAELLKAREEILDLTAKLEVERHRVRKLEAAKSNGEGRLQEAEAREQSDLKALRTLLSSTMRERDEALDKALRLQGVNRSVEELHSVLAKAIQDREQLNLQLDQQQDFVTLQSSLDLVEQLRAEIPSPTRKPQATAGCEELPSPGKDGVKSWSPEANIRVAPVASPKDMVVQQAGSSPRSPSTSMVSTSYGTPQKHLRQDRHR
mmetsp:Transcript_7845/g.17645  ORF Transcript_7845/g.17645 Transcript_7845/m.17645 type:complete len:780 (+) Transcript_7845:54-2393(+)